MANSSGSEKIVRRIILFCILVYSLVSGAAHAATLTGSLASGQLAYYDITLPAPQSGMRLVLSTSASSDFLLYTGTNHTAGTQIAASYGQTLHTLLVAADDPNLVDGGQYHVRIKANASLSYSYTADLSYLRTLSWDNGTTLAGVNVINQPDSAGGDYLFRITGQSPVHPGWRNVLKVTAGEADLYLQQNTPPLGGGSYSSTAVGSDAIYVTADSSLSGQTWYIRVHATPGATWQLGSGDLYVQDLAWDNGSAPGGSSNISQPSSAAGEYFFRITSQAPTTGAWRTVLNVLGGEANFYLQQDSIPFGDTSYKSTVTGSDGLILAANQYGVNQTWYIRVHANSSSTWNIFSGEIYARDIGTVGDTSSIAAATIGPEGTYYYRTSVDATTKAWRLWLNGGGQTIWVRQSSAPVKTAWTEQAEQFEAGQMLLVPPYLTNAVYFIGVTGTPGSSITLDSRRQAVTTLNFNGSAGTNITGYGYTTYRVDVPIDQIAWQINLTPGAAGQNPELYIRSGDIPNRWTNSALSEAPAGVIDSITQVPPTLTDGTWYITVYGSGSFSYTLANIIPVVTGKPFINTSDPNPVPPGYAYPYNTTPITNDDINRSGWRYYQVSDINSQLGFLGWQLDLDAAHQAGREIALRRNAVPSRWLFRNGNSAYSTSVSESYHVDASSNYGFLQHPGHQADIWYIGINTPNQAMGAFQLTTREIPAPLKQVNSSSSSVSGQIANTWQWFKFTVPSSTDPNNAKYEPNFLGWDLRLKASLGNPRMVIRRDQLPADFNTNTGYYTYGLERLSNWQTGLQWAPGIGDMYSNEGYGLGGPTRRYSGDKNSYLIAGMGSPLEAGSYYVGVSGDGSDTAPLSYTLESRGIGIGNDASSVPWPIQVQDLGNFTGGSVSKTGLAPREAVYYRITVPAAQKSWSVKLEPTLGEALMTVRQGALPNMTAQDQPSDSIYYFKGNRRQKAGREFFYKYAESPQTAITAGTYYIAVFSEGQNPPDDFTIGSGNVNFTLTSYGLMPVADKTSTPAAVGTPVTWNGETLQYGQQKVYRFRAPAGLTSMEIRLKNRVGNPTMALRQDAAGSGMIPGPYNLTYIAHEGGYTAQWSNDTLITVPQPVAGDYTLVVGNKRSCLPNWPYTCSDTDNSYDVEVTALTPTTLILDNGSASGSLVDQQIRYYQVNIPATINGYPLAGWKIGTSATNGSAKLYIAKNGIPNAPNQPTLEVTSPFAVLTAPYLEPGTWYIAVQGVGITDYSITSEIISASPDRNSRSWSMPPVNGSFTQPGLAAPWFGDSGIDDSGNPIINPSTGDQGTDLGENDWHFYRIAIPAGNGGILKTVVEALSGKPELYIRKGGVPSPYHRSDANDPNYYNSYAPYAYDRLQSLNGTMYGNWVPLDRRSELQLAPGEWWLGIKAVNSNIRYRLRVAAGNVRDAVGPLDSSGYFQDLNLVSGGKTGQTLAAGDMRYYRLTIPQSSTTQSASTPTAWNLTLNQQVGDVAVMIRDTIPPGMGTDGNQTNPSYFMDWGDDNSYLNPNPYVVIETPGTTTIPTPPLRPGATYYLGVYAITDATFDISSGIGTEKLKLDGVIPFASGLLSTTLAAGEQRLYRIDVPSDALVWHHTAQHDGGIRLYLTQGTVPPNDSYAHWYTYGNADTYLNQNLTGYPWQAGYSYYLLVENTTGAALPFSFNMSGKSVLSRLTLSITATCPGSSVTTSPDVLTCTSGTCGADVMPYTAINLYANPGNGCAPTAWTGACLSSGSNYYCSLPMDQSATTSIGFVDTGAPSITFSIPDSSTTSNVAVTLSASDNVGVTGYCLNETGNSGTCVWSSLPPATYTFSGLTDNTPTGRGLYAFSRDAAGNISTSYDYIIITVTEATLSVTLAGSGSGSVNSNPTGLTCTSGTCSRNFALNSTVGLFATPSSDSTFVGWSGACGGSGACSVSMSSAKAVTATFNLLPPVRLNRATPLYYSTLQDAYNAAVSGDVIQLKEGTLAGSLNMNRAIAVSLKGGYNASYSAVSSSTLLQGTVTLGLGSAVLDRVNIR
ncbi:MAG: hypothetical protein RW306_16160 [Geobacteraceae bacterium]|nr:hypothetical protein [Geobacteraceae bacterium]